MTNETKIPLFRRFVIQNFPFIEQDFDALTDYQLISKVVEYLNKVIESQNGLVDDMNSLTTAFYDLKNYVDHYFDNLDVQEEINNKLDDMAEAGTLQEIITSYIQANVAWCFDTVADMKLATNLVDGSYAQTLGFYSINDGGGALYKITSTGTSNKMDVIAVGDLYANLVYGKAMYAEQFGAKPASGFDNKSIIEYAIAHTNTLRFNSGNFYTSGYITLTANTTLIGDNTKLYSDSPFILKGVSTDNIFIDSLEFESTVDTTNTINLSETEPDSRGYTTLSALIDISGSDNIKIENCKTHGSFTGIYCHECNNVIVKDNECYASSSKIICLSLSKFKLVNNYIHDVLVNGTDCYPCYLFQATDGTDIDSQEASLIDGNRFENNTNWDAIMSHRYDKLIITNNHISNVRNGIDLTIVTSDENNGNILIDNNYLDGTSTNRWGSESGLNHGIIIIGDNKTSYINITNNIVKGFGRFTSPSGGSCIHLQSTTLCNIENNIIDFDETVNTISGAIMIRNTNNKLNVCDNIINAHALKTILFNNATCDGLNVLCNILTTTGNVAIDTNATVSLTHAKIDNSFNSTYQMNVRQNNVLNDRTFESADARPTFSSVERYVTSIDTFDVPANSVVRKWISKTSIGKGSNFETNSLFTVSPMFGTLPYNCYLQATYGDSGNISLCFFNTSGSSITIPTGSYTVKIEK